jgi:hypothetical protein
VDGQEAKLHGIAGGFGGVPGGERAYILTYVIAYIRVSDLKEGGTCDLEEVPFDLLVGLFVGCGAGLRNRC